MIVNIITSITTATLTTIITTFITTFIKATFKNRVNQPFFHLTMCNAKKEPVRLEQTHGLNKILRISNDSQDVLALDVALALTVRELNSANYYKTYKILSNEVDNENPIFIEAFDGLPTVKDKKTICYQIESAELFYTTSTHQKRSVDFERNSKIFIQKGKPHRSNYSLTDEEFSQDCWKNFDSQR